MSGIMAALGAGTLLFCLLVTALGPRAQKKDKIRSRLDDLGQDVFRADLRRTFFCILKYFSNHRAL